MVGPPISMFSMASSRELLLEIVFLKGYKLTTTRSISSIEFFSISSLSFILLDKIPA